MNSGSGGQVLRNRALDSYYQNPNRCLYCGSVIVVGEKQQVNAVRKKKFCDKSHAAKYNNRKRPRRAPTKRFCRLCGVELEQRKLPSGYFSRRKYCDSCFRRTYTFVDNITKGELFADAPHYTARRTWITSRARSVYMYSGKPFVCAVCSYSKHVHVCHIKNVSEFADDITIGYINRLDNLVALCPNHHWEFDHGEIDISVDGEP